MVTLLILAFAVALGSLAGYWIHRALHQPWSGPFHRGHMEHHLEIYPTTRLTSDRYEVKKWYNSGPVLFTPGAVLLLILGAGLTWMLNVSLWHFITFGVGLVGFGLLNDWVHDAFHLRDHVLKNLSYFRKLRRLHFLHHFNMERNYGIVSLHWDAVFKTKEG
jgi:sterol desaturase/sphingolipid hydroxylase (fatty acid hydroxylase superfamily)